MADYTNLTLLREATTDEERQRYKALLSPAEQAKLKTDRKRRRQSQGTQCNKKKKLNDATPLNIRSDHDSTSLTTSPGKDTKPNLPLIKYCPLCDSPLLASDRQFMIYHLTQCTQKEIAELAAKEDASKLFPFNKGINYMNVSAHTEPSPKAPPKSVKQAAGKCVLTTVGCKKKLFSKQGVDFHIHGHKRHLCKIEHLKDSADRSLFDTTVLPNLSGLIEAAPADGEKIKACTGPKCNVKCSTSLFVTGGTKLIDDAEKSIWYFCSLKCLLACCSYTKAASWRAYTNKLDPEYQAKQAAKSTLSNVDEQKFSAALLESILFSSVVGVSVVQFEELCSQFSPIVNAEFSSHPRALQPREHLLLTLIFLRQYPTESFLATIFQVSQSTVSRYLTIGLAALTKMTTSDVYWPSDIERVASSIKIRGERVTIVIDGVEQPIIAPVLKLYEQIFFSGKKHLHTITKLLGVLPSGKIAHIGPSLPGSTSDVQQYKHKANMIHTKLTANEAICADAGFIGIQKFHKLVVPFENSVIAKITDKEKHEECKKFNKEVARYRTVVENVFAHIKAWKICDLYLRVADRHTDPQRVLDFHDQIWRICAALVNRFEMPLRVYDA